MDEAVSFWRHDSREGAIAHVPDHLSVAELEQRYRSSEVATSARHYQTSWLLTQGHTIPEVSPTISFASRWVEDFWPATPRLARRRCPDISNPASDHHRAHDGRRRNGHHRPDHLRSAIDAARPSVRHREPPRSGIAGGHGRGGPYGAGWVRFVRGWASAPESGALPKFNWSEPQAATLVGLTSRSLLELAIGIARGFIASGISRKRSTCRSPFSRLAPLT